MNVDTYRTSDLAQAVGISVQQVRNYEASGLLPLAQRSLNGYRRYTQQHLAALKAARHLIHGYGWQLAQQIMQAVHSQNVAAALACIDECHGELAASRAHLEQTLAAIRVLTAQLPMAHTLRGERLRVGAAATMVGVRVSALRFWEQCGLLQPSREAGSRYRVYDGQQLRRLRIVVLLRQANYDFAAIQAALTELDAGQPQRSLAAIEQRRDQLAARSWQCFEASSSLYSYICEFVTERDARP